MSKNKPTSLPAISDASIRQLLVEGKSKTALDDAKQFYKANNNAGSEQLLIEAYAARIQALRDQNLELEAKSLIEVVRERFKGARERIDALLAGGSLQGDELTALLRRLNDPELTADARTAIEQTIRTQVVDLAAVANCPDLAPDHMLRQVAGALNRAFELVTSGPVTDEQLELPEVTHRSPLAGWKLLIRAIASFYRGEDEVCKELLGTIKPDSAVSRAARVMQVMIEGTPEAPLKQREAKLVAAVQAGAKDLRSALEALEHAFKNADRESVTLKAIRIALQECRRSVPERLPLFKQIVAVRGEVCGLDLDDLMSALEGGPHEDSEYFRMKARALDGLHDIDELFDACEAWDKFREHAIREGRFAADGEEVAVLYLHMASLYEDYEAREIKHGRAEYEQYSEVPKDPYYLFPEKLYQRACASHPHEEGFVQWLSWAEKRTPKVAEKVAKEWNRARPGDLAPVLYLLKRAEERNAYPTALGLLAQAEKIDTVNAEVRGARLRLLFASTLRYLQQKKPHLAEQKLAELAGLPRMLQGDRPMYLAALRHTIAFAKNRFTLPTEGFAEVEKAAGGRIAAIVAVFGLGHVCKLPGIIVLPLVKDLSKEEKDSIPAALAKVRRLNRDLRLLGFPLPQSYVHELDTQLPVLSASLSVDDLLELAEIGNVLKRTKLVWDATNAGLAKGGPLESFFLYSRARALPELYAERRDVLLAAAAELARFHERPEFRDQALSALRMFFRGEPLKLTLEQARVVLTGEKESRVPPSPLRPGPSYSELIPEERLCNCTDCQRRRGEPPDLFGDDDDEDFDVGGLGPPPQIMDAITQLINAGMAKGKSPEEVLAEILGAPPPGFKKKGKKK